MDPTFRNQEPGDTSAKLKALQHISWCCFKQIWKEKNDQESQNQGNDLKTYKKIRKFEQLVGLGEMLWFAGCL